MNKPLKSQALSILALVVLAVLGFFAAEAISGMVEVRLKKRVQPSNQVQVNTKINWIAPHQASVRALDEQKSILCVFTSTLDNAECRKLEQEFLADEKVCEYINKNFIAVIVIDNPSLPDSSTEKVVEKNYGISTFPTVLVTDPDGKILEQKNGFSSKDDLFKLLTVHAKTHQVEKIDPAAINPPQP